MRFALRETCDGIVSRNKVKHTICLLLRDFQSREQHRDAWMWVFGTFLAWSQEQEGKRSNTIDVLLTKWASHFFMHLIFILWCFCDTIQFAAATLQFQILLRSLRLNRWPNMHWVLSTDSLSSKEDCFVFVWLILLPQHLRFPPCSNVFISLWDSVCCARSS